MPSRKTLHDLIQRPDKPHDGKVPHVFHRHGALKVRRDAIDLPDDRGVWARTEMEKITAYGVVAAGDSMVPYDVAGDKELAFSLRHAVSTSLMSEIGGHSGDVVISTDPFKDLVKNVFHSALWALLHYGSANQKPILQAAKKSIRSHGLKYQATMLEPMITAGIEMAMENKLEDLNWWMKEFHSLYGTAAKPNPQSPAPLPPKPLPPIEIPCSMTPGEGDSSKRTVQWGPVESISKVPMKPWNHPHIRSEKSWKYSEFGVFKYPWRALPSSDYRCFSLYRRKYGGTVLIDMSGSMSISQQEMEAVLHAAPYATVAGYGSMPESCDMGRIVIVAEDSMKGSARRARERIGQGNVIDGPALRWLASMPAPRIWISDGGVTGVGDGSCTQLRNEANAICRSGGILRISTLGKLIKQLGIPEVEAEA